MSQGKVHTIIQMVLLYFLCAPPLAFGLVSTFMFVPDFLMPVDRMLSVIGGVGPLLIAISLLLVAGVIMLNTETNEDVEAAALFG